MEDFIRQTLRISVAQICDNIGWHSITDSSMQIMTDILHRYISDLAISSKKYAEHAYSNVPDIEDVEKALRQKSVSLSELRSYVKSTGPVKFPHNLPKLNIPGKNVLNPLKPGSREIVSRPIHIHEHLPTMYAEPVEEKTTDTEEIQNSKVNDKQEPKAVILHKRLREISSVVMTSGGFLSPSREGRLADSKLLPFPEIKNDKPLETSKLSAILPNIKNEPSSKVSLRKKKIKSKKFKSGIKKKQKSSKDENLLVLPKELEPEVLKKEKKPKEEKMLTPIEPIIEPNIEPVMNELDDIDVTEEVQTPKKGISAHLTNKAKMEEVLPKFSFFGPLPQGPGLIPSTFSQIDNKPDIDKTQKPTSSVLKVEDNDISRKEQKKKKKDKKKEKKEKKKQKDKDKEITKEKKKEKSKCTNKVPKIKLKLGSRMETNTNIFPDKPSEEIISIVSEPEPMEVEVDIESKSDISLGVLCDDIKSPPKVPISKIKTKIVTKTAQPVITPAVETPPPPFYFDEAGNQVWICPMCTKPDDGSPMIGCDGCDVWYHWVCVGIQCPPDCAVWYCPKCLEKRAQQPKGKRGRPRKNKF